MKNYFEHETKVKIIDAIFSKEKDWQWFITHIENNFELNDITNWLEFENQNSESRDILSFLIKITENEINELIFTKDVLFDIYQIANFFNNKEKKETIQQLIKTEYGNILFLFTYITKLINRDNETDYIIDKRIYRNKNFWELINFNSVYLNSEEIIKMVEDIDLEGFDKYKQCIIGNLKKIYYECTPLFIEKYKNNFLNVNAFEPQYLKINEPITWEENYLLDMLHISFRGKGIIPLMEMSGHKTPNDTLWTKEIIKHIKKFFTGVSEALFILETIEYIKYGTSPSTKTKEIHLKLINEETKSNKNNINFYSSSLTVISEIFKDKLTKDISNSTHYISFIKNIQTEKEAHNIERIQGLYLPISTEQKEILKKFQENQYKLIDEVKTESQFNQYIQNLNPAKIINLEYFFKICDKFTSFITSEISLITAFSFYNFMNYLFEMKEHNSEVNPRIIEEQMIALQKIWKDNFYEKVNSSLQEYTFKYKISNEKMEEYNKEIINNPNIFVIDCLPISKESICKQMEYTSQHALSLLVQNVDINENFPFICDKNDLCKKHDIDTLLNEIIKEIKENYGYRFLNILDNNEYLYSLHKEWKNEILLKISLFSQEQILYENIKNISSIELISFDKLTIAHISQLFPLLEIKIRELAELVGVFPFKNKPFMKYKDPSSILISLLKDVYYKFKDFEPVNDIFFVYNIMYNSNSLNIRNEFIHGRKYIDESKLNIAFKLTLISIYIIEKRIEKIKKYIENNKENN